MGYGEFSDFYFSRQPKYGHSKNVLKYPPIGAILRGVLQQPPEGGWDQTKYGHGHTPWVLDQPWYQNRVTRFGHFPLGFEGLANEHLKKTCETDQMNYSANGMYNPCHYFCWHSGLTRHFRHHVWNQVVSNMTITRSTLPRSYSYSVSRIFQHVLKPLRSRSSVPVLFWDSLSA